MPRTPLVLFDLGEVLSSAAGLLERLAELCDLHRDDVREPYWRHRDSYDLGACDDEYWGAVMAEAREATGAPATPLPPGLVEALVQADAELWTQVRAAPARLIRRLVEGGIDVGVLSNAPHPIARRARRCQWGEGVRHWFFSAELGLAKPDPMLYARVLELLAVDPGQIVFFDDRAANVEAACRAGWDARLWQSDQVTAERLTALGLVRAGG